MNYNYWIYFRYISDIFQMYIVYLPALSNKCMIFALYLSDIYYNISCKYRVPDMFMMCYRYFTTQYVCEMIMIFILYVTEFLHLYYTYHVPDMRVFVKYRTHILCISHTYLVPDMYPMLSILTSVKFSYS